MISPYEVAYLCGHAYRPDPQVLPMSYSLNIPDAGTWGVGAHVGVSSSFFCTKYIKSGTYDTVIAFRGTVPTSGADLAVDAVHLVTRNSSYINAARRFLSSHRTNNTIVVGHSLGGFIAITMAFHFPLKVAAINPPWMINFFSSAVDHYEATTSRNFMSSKVIVYQSNTDVVTGATHQYRLRTRNINFVRVGALGWHNLDPIIENFRRSRRFNIRW